MPNAIDEYINRYDGEKKEWLAALVGFMRQTFPEIPETISYQMPMYKFNRTYIAFSVAKEHFTYHTLDFEMIEALKTLLPKAKFGRGSAKIPFSSRESMPVLFEMCKKIVERSRKSATG